MFDSTATQAEVSMADAAGRETWARVRSRPISAALQEGIAAKSRADEEQRPAQRQGRGVRAENAELVVVRELERQEKRGKEEDRAALRRVIVRQQWKPGIRKPYLIAAGTFVNVRTSD